MAPLSQPRIDALLGALRAAGLGASITDSLRVAEVLRVAASEAGGAEPRAIDLTSLRDLLRCVVASTVEERATFDRVFDAWRDLAEREIERRAPRGEEIERTPERRSPSTAPHVEQRPVERHRPRLRWFPSILAAAALGGVAGGLAFRLWPRTQIQGADAGTVVDAGVVDEPDAGEYQRPTTFRAREIVFTVEPSAAERAMPWQIVLTLAAAAAAIALGRVVRRSSWLPRVLAPPRVPGPPEVPPLPIAEGLRAAGLFTMGERDDLAFAVDRFIREEPSPEIDPSRSIDATIAAGGRSEIVFRPRIEHRTVWLWTDVASSSPLVDRLADEVAASLAAAGLPSDRGRFASVPDRVDSDTHGPLEPRELEDAALGSAVLLVTDGDGLAGRLDDSASRGWVRPLLRVLSRWPRIAFVAVADGGRRALASAFSRFDVDIRVIAPDEVQAFLAGQDATRVTRGPTRLVGDTLAWASACCLSERRVDAVTALAVRAAMKLDAPVWALEVVLADVADAVGANAAVGRKAERLRWFAQVSGAGRQGQRAPESSPLRAALTFFRDRLVGENEERMRRNEGDPWIDTPAQRVLLRQIARLDLWTVPDSALAELHRLYPSDDPARHEALSGYGAGMSHVELRAPQGVIGLPWSMRELEDVSRLLAQDLGLQVLGGDEDRFRKQVPGRAILAVGVVLGMCAGVGVGSVAKWWRRPRGMWMCKQAPDIWCDTRLDENGISALAGSGRVMASPTAVRLGSIVVPLLGAERRFACREEIDATTSSHLCGLRETPIPRKSGWRTKLSVGVVVGNDDDKEREAWADALLDSGSVDRVIVTHELKDEDLAYFPQTLGLLAAVQLLVVNLNGRAHAEKYPPEWAVAELTASPSRKERTLLTGTEVRDVAEVWSSAKILAGEPQLAGVAVAMAQVDAGAASPGDPVGPIHNSFECPYREVEDNGMLFVSVCSGTFQMGSKDDDKDADSDEKPAHLVTVSTFWMGKYEVSNAEYWRFDPAHDKEQAPGLPATNLFWNDAEKMCASLGHRLPTEAEWEYAARGPEGRKYPWGDAQPTEKLAVFSSASVAAAKSFLDVGSPFGTVNQAGNAYEWIQDCYDGGAYQKLVGRTTIDPSNVDCPAGRDRMVRGGSFVIGPWDLRSAVRVRLPPENGHRLIGFRCARGPRRQP